MLPIQHDAFQTGLLGRRNLAVLCWPPAPTEVLLAGHQLGAQRIQRRVVAQTAHQIGVADEVAGKGHRLALAGLAIVGSIAIYAVMGLMLMKDLS